MPRRAVKPDPFVMFPDELVGTFSNEAADAKAPTLEDVVDAVEKLRHLTPRIPTRAEVFPVYSHATFTFDGVEFPMDEIKWVAYSAPELEPTYGFDVMRLLEHRYTFELTAVCTVKVRRRVWRDFMRGLRRPRRFTASFATLMRRAGYGGRKGRRALRRLLALPDAAWKAEIDG